MSLVPQNAKEISLDGATVVFYEYETDGVKHYQFDTSKTGHPEPMVNAMTGLQHLKDGEKLVMINHKPPMGLFPKIEADFDYEVQTINENLHKIIFTKKANAAGSTDYDDKNCEGE